MKFAFTKFAVIDACKEYVFYSIMCVCVCRAVSLRHSLVQSKMATI